MTQRAAPDVFGPNGENYANNSPSQDLARIGISVKTDGKGDSCKPGDWATVHWSAYLMDNRMVSDSKSEGQGLPKVFNVGKSEVFKCWDLAVPQLQQGTKATVICPAHYVWGNAYTQAPLGGEPIPLNSDVRFELDVVECNRTPDEHSAWTERGDQPRTTTMQEKVCLYMHHRESEENESTPLVLNCDEKGCGLEEWVWDDFNQQFWWNVFGYGLLCTLPDGRNGKPQCLGIGEKNRLQLVAPQNANEVFFNDKEQTLEVTNKAGLTFEMTTPQARKWSDVIVAPFAKYHVERSDKLSKWRIEYCWHEDKPNPENTPEGIPQNLRGSLINWLPRNYHEAGSVPMAE